MKILAIRGKNLASLEGEFNIDFDAEPLKSAGIFAITGPTGAGKSTILDAMCLALFDDAPRLGKGEKSIQVNDVSDKTISQTDSRVILRKGAGEGRAEVDFIAVNGEKYRSIWSVKRVGNRPDGVLQNTVIRVYNLQTDVEEQGTKTALLKKITALTGLTFNQFIRAVLLAQGDFATFLKAKQSDKAELLEKLTGTDIYSKISVAVFQRTKEAIETVTSLQKQIDGTVLLKDEEIIDFNQKKSQIDKELLTVKDILPDIDRKLGWIKQYEELLQETGEAEKELKAAKQSIEAAKPRYAYIELLDISLEIRDIYINLENKTGQLKELKSNLSSQELQLKKYDGQISVFNTGLQEVKTGLEQLEQDFAGLKPLIARSKELDIKIQSAKEKLAEAEKELNLKKAQKVKSETNVLNINKNLSEIKRQSEIITGWFKEKEPFKNIVQQVDLITATLNDIRFAEKQIGTASENLDTNNALLTAQKEILAQSEKELERLNSLLPAEVLNLREKLEENKPCPVCGSIHHPFKTEINMAAKVNERELEKKKRETADVIAGTNKKIESIKESITQLDTLVKGYKTQYGNAVTKIEKPLQAIANWKNFINSGVLQERVSNLANKWKENEKEQAENLKKTELYLETLNVENTVLADISAECLRRETSYKDARSMLESLMTERSTLLDGKNAGEVELSCNSAIEQQSEKYGKLKNSKAEIENRKSEITGVISAIRENIETFSTQITELKTTVDIWLLNNKHHITQDILRDLVKKSFAWIAGEKKELAGLKDREIRFAATCRERNARLGKHNESPYKPADGETKESLKQLFEDTVNREKELKHQQTSIEVTLAKHSDNKKLAESLNAELKIKSEICEDWKKLNSLLGSADGHRFKNIIQSYTMDILLEYANKHLEILTKRYKLEKNGDTLALQVIDNDMLGEIRTIHSLSGGESFLISLALALGLSSLSSNRMQIESLFIDEGFGSLDTDTLNIAIDALENLYTRGRKIGIISHMGEMRIPTQIKVIKSINGKSEIKITGNN
ncbi:MAG: AAA family ATPase [Prevotellaceae bacterium]|jgi:exonuclease SbcC|nr:AAA family ATPase [Prevotellaceae bacterium]